jgi:hypothetical protein
VQNTRAILLRKTAKKSNKLLQKKLALSAVLAYKRICK